MVTCLRSAPTLATYLTLHGYIVRLSDAGDVLYWQHHAWHVAS